jgi:cell division protein FtsI (penicillin-binding protein 3)
MSRFNLKIYYSLAAFLFLSVSASAQDAAKPSSIIPEINAVVEKNLNAGLERYQAKAAAALIMNAKTGEVVASVTVHEGTEVKSFDIIQDGVFEFGSSAKIMTVAAGLESKMISMKSKIDATNPLKIGRFTIGDYHAQRRILTVQETLLFSSNIGAAKIALKVGPEYQELFRRSLGLYDRIGRGADSILPKDSSKIITAANGFGHGFAITPLHAASVFASLTSLDGRVVRPTFVKGESQSGFSIVSPLVNEEIRKILRLNVEIGAAKSLNLSGFDVGAMTATAEKVFDGRYSIDRVMTSVIAVVPVSKPKFVFLTFFDEPQGLEKDHGFRTAAWNAGRVTADIIRETAGSLGLQQGR